MDFRKMLKKNCNSCGSEFTSFTLFTRQSKKRCETCMLSYCTRCMFTTNTPRKCRRCLIFNQNPITKEGLNSLRVRDLKWYLAQKNISSETYSEKRELVELIILSVRRPSARSNSNYNSTDTRSHNTTGPIPFRDAPERASFSEPNTHSSSVPPSPTRAFNDFGSTSQPATHTSPNDQATPTSSSSSNTNPIPPTDSASSVDANAAPPRSNLTSTTAASTPNLSSAETNTKFEPFNLDDITEEADIHGLSIRQLKVVLARNYVDFRGCVEKDELVQRTIRLWNDHQGKQKYMEENEDNLEIDADACKICMVQPIDCVLLECGHMVTCTQCGKQLPECPICRQFISRVVHVFKS